jgi:hypothetical protein
MSADVKRIKPLETQNARARTSALGFRRDLNESLFERSGEHLSLMATPGRLADAADIIPNVFERVRCERKHARLLGQTRQSRRKVIGRSGAHVAEVLSNNKIGCERGQQFRINGI